MAVAIVWLLSISKWNLLSLFEYVNNFIEFKKKERNHMKMIKIDYVSWYHFIQKMKKVN